MHPSEKWNADVRANVQKYGTPIAPQQQGFNPASLLPAIGGTIGAIGGGIIGGPAGAGIGGALGGGAGSALEQAISGKPLDVGKVGQEAALSGVLGYGPLRALGLVTGVKGGRILADVVGGGAGAQVAAQGAAAVPKLTGVAGRAAAIQTGIAAQTKYLGKQLGTPKATQVLNTVYNKAGVGPTLDATAAFPKVEAFTRAKGAELGSLLKSTKVAPREFATAKNTLLADVENRFSKVRSINYKNSEFAKQTLKDIRAAKSPRELWQIKKDIADEAVNFARGEAAAVPGGELFARKSIFSINKTLDNLIPNSQYKTLNQDFSHGMIAQDIIGQTARVPKGISAPIVGKVGPKLQQRVAGVVAGTGRQATQGLAPATTRLEQALRYGGQGRAPLVTGTAAERIAGLQALGPAGIARGVAAAVPSAVKRQALVRLAGGALGTAEPTVTDEQALVESTQPQAAPVVNPYPVENMLYDVSRDPKNSSKYIAIFNTVQANIKEQTKTAQLTEAQQTRVDVTNLVDQVRGMLDAGGVKIGPGGVLGKIEMAKAQLGAGDPKTVDFYTMLGNLTATIARSRGGTSFTANEQRLLNRYTPNEGDSEQQIRSKLNNLAKMFPPTGSQGSTVYNPADIQNQVMQGLGG